VGNHLYCQVDHSSSAVGSSSLPQAKALSVLHSLLPALTKLTFVSAVTALTLEGLAASPHCVRKVEKCLHGLGPGLHHCDIDLSEGRAVVEYDPDLLSPGRLIEAVAALDGGKFSARLHRDFESAVRGNLGPVATKEDDPLGFQGLYLFDHFCVLLMDWCCTGTVIHWCLGKC
jgi:copper chaperone CopZ